MKTCLLLFSFLLAATGSAVGADAAAADRVGVYDSRIVAYAHFWSPPAAQERDALIARAQAAKQAGATAEFERYSRAIGEISKRSHRQVFGTEPPAEALAALAPRLADLQRELGVARLVSKWDAAALRRVPAEQRIDVTDRLVSEFIVPDERQRKVIAEMKAKPPRS